MTSPGRYDLMTAEVSTDDCEDSHSATSEKKSLGHSTQRCCCSLRALLQPTQDVDRGWAWVVCASCFFINFVVFGTFASFGVLYTGLLEYYTAQNSTRSYCETNKNESGISAVTGTIDDSSMFYVKQSLFFSRTLILDNNHLHYSPKTAHAIHV